MAYINQYIARESTTIHIYAGLFVHFTNQNNDISKYDTMFDYEYVVIQSLKYCIKWWRTILDSVINKKVLYFVCNCQYLIKPVVT